MDTEMPEGWLVDAPEFVADPSAEMPEDWDEEEDGEWEAPQIKNPACTAAPGCGEWKRPMIPNPDYKGKWEHPMIDNPDYIGEWKAKQIPNPEYFSEETHPEAFHTLVAPIGGVAIEIWTMSSGIHFDNIYIGNDIIAAQEWAEASYGTKDAHEKKLLKAEAAKKRHEERAKRLEEGGFMNVLGYYFGEVGDVLADNLIATVITAALGMMAMIYWCCIAGAGEAAESDAYLPEEEDEDLDEVPDDEKDKAEEAAQPKAEEAAQPKAEDVAPKKEDTKAAEGDVNPESAAGSPKKKKKKKKAPKA